MITDSNDISASSNIFEKLQKNIPGYHSKKIIVIFIIFHDSQFTFFRDVGSEIIFNERGC